MRETEKRSSAGEIENAGGGESTCLGRVGARHGGIGLSGGGGGYLNIFTGSNFEEKNGGAKKIDPRMDELREMGMQRFWLAAAERFGVDWLLEFWRMADADIEISQNGMVSMAFRPYRSYLRYQRNRYIEELVGRGIGPDEIRALLIQQLGEKISKRHILRLVQKG